MGEDPLETASRTGLSWGTVGMDTGIMVLVWCPGSGKQKDTTSLETYVTHTSLIGNRTVKWDSNRRRSFFPH